MSRLSLSLRHLPRTFSTSVLRLQEPRINQVGIQYLSSELQKKVFPTTSPSDYLKVEHPCLLSLVQQHLKNSGLLNKKTRIDDPILIPNLPELVGKNTLDEHFTRIGYRYSQPYLSMAENFLLESNDVLPKPQQWLFSSGWTRYAPGCDPEKVDYPLEDELVFDVEVMYKRSNYGVMCTAMSSKAWYGWVSPLLTEYAKDPSYSDWDHFIPLNTHASPKLLIGYNVSYDRARILEEYSVKQSKAFFLDAMSFHIALSGFCSQQRPTWNKFRKHKLAVENAELESESSSEYDADSDDPMGLSASDVAQELMDDPWLNKGSLNSLANVAEFYCDIQMKKDIRDNFSSTNVSGIIDNFQELMNYCADDVIATYKVSQKLFPEFRKKIPHPVSFAALRLLGSLFLPTSRSWDSYVESAESVYQKNRQLVDTILRERVNELVRYIGENDDLLRPDMHLDPWLKQLNWTIKPERLRKDGTRYARQAYLTGYPEWYRDLFKTTTEKDGEKQREMNITVRTRITPLLLRLNWEGYPLIWTDSAGWCFKVPYENDVVEEMLQKNYTKAELSEEDLEMLLPELREEGMIHELFKVPHPEGSKKRCTLIMSKSYIKFFENGVLTSEYDYAKEILDLNATASYWMGNRARIMDQFVVYCDPKGEKNKFFDTKKDCKTHKEMGMIIPKLCTMGTVTRRATENTWLTASNSKANRIGSELKAMITAPKGYAFVGADVDSEELWIASLIGDSMFQIHGGTALGWMTLEGDKHEKTDLHSKTAEIMGILRNDAKVFNYGRIYGAGVKFATRLLKQCNASLSDAEAEEKAQKLYEQTKGQVSHSKLFLRRLYHGGTESVMFNALESIAYQDNPKTPTLGASITDALTQRHLNKNNYLTSRINWTIQSSGVDYLHLLIVSMEYLIEKFKLDARLMITVHDELRYFVREDQKLLCALLLQISNLWTRAMFCEQLGISELPQSCAFFSEVDIDFVLRKEVGMECITPSHPTSIAPGESYDIVGLLKALDPSILETNNNSLQHLKNHKFVPREPVIQNLIAGCSSQFTIAKLALENSASKDEWKSNMSKIYKVQRDDERLKGKTLEQTSGAKTKTLKTKTLKTQSKYLNSSNAASAQTPAVPLAKPTRTSRKKILTESPSSNYGSSKLSQFKNEEYDLCKDGDDLLRREVEKSFRSSNLQTGEVSRRKIPQRKLEWLKDRASKNGPVVHGAPGPKNTKLSNIFGYSSPRTKPEVNPTPVTGAKYNFPTMATTSRHHEPKLNEGSRLKSSYQKPSMKSNNYGFSLVNNIGFAKPSLAHSPRSNRRLAAGHLVQTKNLHSSNTADDNFERRSQIEVTDDTRGAHRRLRRRAS